VFFEGTFYLLLRTTDPDSTRFLYWRLIRLKEGTVEWLFHFFFLITANYLLNLILHVIARRLIASKANDLHNVLIGRMMQSSIVNHQRYRIQELVDLIEREFGNIENQALGPVLQIYVDSVRLSGYVLYYAAFSRGFLAFFFILDVGCFVHPWKSE
jgi:ABC-type multidrug transport system fused ATPase/permease subunit